MRDLKLRLRNRRGSALLLMILTVLILTIIGLGVIYFMQVEDRLSGNSFDSKRSFYAAEAGLRVGHHRINQEYAAATVPNFLGTLLKGTPVQIVSGVSAYPLVLGAESFSQIPVDDADTVQGTFTLYVRNDSEDPALVDTNATINIIAVGEAPGGVDNPVQRIIEQQVTILNAQPASPPTQAGGGPGGSGSVAIGN